MGHLMAFNHSNFNKIVIQTSWPYNVTVQGRSLRKKDWDIKRYIEIYRNIYSTQFLIDICSRQVRSLRRKGGKREKERKKERESERERQKCIIFIFICVFCSLHRTGSLLNEYLLPSSFSASDLLDVLLSQEVNSTLYKPI